MDNLILSRVISVTKDFDFETVDEVQRNLIELCSQDRVSPITMTVSCRGGNCDAGFGLYDMIMFMLKPSLTTVGLGHVGSMAVIVYLSGAQRFISRNSHIFLHEIGTKYEQSMRIKRSEIDRKSDHLKNHNDKYVKIVQERTGLNKRTIQKMIDSETYLSPKDAVKLGFAHKIL